MEEQTCKDPVSKPEKTVTKQNRVFPLFWLGLGLLGIFLLLAFGAIVYIFIKFRPLLGFPTTSPSIVSKKDFKKFTSEEEFIEFIKKGETGYGAFLGPTVGVERFGISDLALPEVGAPTMLEKAIPERVSETTVQVKGIDEPDIVKTDGRQIYFSSDRSVIRSMPERIFLPEPGISLEEDRLIPPIQQAKTKVIKAFPPAELGMEEEIEKIGDLLLKDKILVIFSRDNKIWGFDVSDPASPTQKWNVEFKENNRLVGARLYQGKVYFITQGSINRSRPCPIIPLTVGGAEFSVRCVDIYHPVVDMPIDVTFTAFVLNLDNGQIEKSVSFVGSSGQSVIYMSPNALYATYNYYEDILDFYYKFLSEKGKDLVLDSLIERLDKVRGYDISNQAKMTEFNQILEQYYNSLDDDERMKVENEFNNRMNEYSQEHMRELEKMGIIKIGLGDFSILATGDIPGRPLNQFSLDEYQDNLRVATTVGGRMLTTTMESANDVYVLDSNLNQLGAVKDLALGERIYSARFIEDKGYLVTFKQIDPFFVLDLSDPRKPQVKGELKIPGYSSYLHPITQDKILGIGKEEPKVKISLFDVTKADSPTEVSKYLLDEYWSDILNTHHAFLLDKDHGVFFLPGSKGGYIFSYEGNDLSLKKAVSGVQARRAIYINDYMYIIGDNKIVVLNEADWEQVNQLEF